jgi:magnesium transporter
MTNVNQEHHYTENVQDHLTLVESLLKQHALLEEEAHRQEVPREDPHNLVGTPAHKQHLDELQRKLDGMHPADVAFILEALPLEQRRLIWDLVKAERDGDILIEVSDAVRESLIATMSREELREVAEQLDTDELADLAPDLPQHVMRDVFRALSIDERERLREAPGKRPREKQDRLVFPSHGDRSHFQQAQSRRNRAYASPQSFDHT